MGARACGPRERRVMTAVARVLTHPRSVLGAQVAVGLVFLAAALAKIGDAGAFARQIHY